MSSFCLIIIIQLIVSYFVIERIGEINNLKSQINSINSNWYEIRNNSLNYFNQESRNADYFQTGRSEYLWKIKRLYKEVKTELAVLMNDENIKNMEIHKYAESARITFYKYHTYFHEIEVRLLAKGYRDHGLEGEMRRNMNELENSKTIALDKLLMIRRNEKDFILRGEYHYSKKAIELSQEMIQSLEKTANGDKKIEVALLKEYIRSFNDYVEHSRAIGFSNKSGLRNGLNKQAILLDRDLLKLRVKFNKQYQEQTKLLIGILILTAFIIIILSIVLSIIVSNNISKPIVKLVRKLKVSISADKGAEGEYQLPKNAPKEVRSLDKAFTTMLDQIKHQVSEINGINTELKTQNDELTQLNHELDRFIYHTSHDLRSPLTSVSGLIEIVETSEEEDIQEYLDHMKFCINQLDQTIIEIIHFYKNRSTETRKEAINLHDSVKIVFEQNKFHPQAFGIDFRTEIDPSFQLCSDSYRLNIILGNLITNAIKYHDAKKKNQFILVRCIEEKGNWIIEIEDNGLGIAENHIKRIFEMFYRASDQSTGSGLGLYIVSESVKKINGEIELESIVKEGSVFRIILPIIEFIEEEQVIKELA